MYDLTPRDPSESPERPNIAPLKFWVEYAENGAFEMVRYAKKGQTNMSDVVEKVMRLSKPMTMGGINPVWVVLKPHYDAWKANEAAPINGTPLEVWPGATADLIAILRTYQIRSIEDLTDMEESAAGRIPVPGLRTIIQRAKAFREALPKAKLAEELARKDERIEALEKEMAELKQLVGHIADEEGRPRRGRPPKARPELDE